MAPYSPPHAAATRKQSHPNVIIDGIKKDSELRTHARNHIPARRASVPVMVAASVHDETTSRWQSAPSSPQASSTDAQATATDMDEDIVELPEFVGNELDFDDAWRSITQIVDAADFECAGENGELLEVLAGSAATHQPTEGNQIAPVGSLEMYWSPWESELLQDEFWDSESVF